MKAQRLKGFLGIWLFSLPVPGWCQFDFSSPIPVISYTTVYDMSFGDLDRDGFTDLVLGRDQDISVSRSNGDGTFGPPTMYPNGGWTAVTDMNGDGKLDVAVVSRNGLTIWLGNGDGTLAGGAESPGLGSQPNQVAPIDFNGDGHTDLLVSRMYPQTGMVIFYGAGNGTVAEPVDLPAAADLFVSGLAAEDFNEDGNADFATAAFDPEGKESRVTIALGDGTGGLLGLEDYDAGASNMPIGDLNGDGHLDIAGCPVMLGVGNGTFVFQDLISSCGAEGLSDFNGDGHLDSYRSGLAVVGVAAGQGDGTFGPPEEFQTDTGPDAIVQLYGGQVAFGSAPDIMVLTQNFSARVTLLANELTIDAIFADGFD